MLNTFYYVYVLFSDGDKKLYTGYSKNLKLRFEQRCKGEVQPTMNRRPLKVIYYEACLSQDDALRREKFLKTFYGKMYIHKRLKSYFTG
jgi:putative endonuclease